MDIRPSCHFTPIKGWINDPNGLIYVDGKFHLFAQHYLDDTHWGPMHWAHAVSTDLINWEHLPIAIYPTEDEYAFSGSAILDYENVSGLGDGSTPVMLLFYTAHNPKTGEQQQCISYSNDYVNFTRYEGNPVIANTKDTDGFKPDFRDPKVIVNSINKSFTMVLAAGHAIEFYESTNLIDWIKTGEFVPGKLGYDGICECPDLIRFEMPDGDKYVHTMSMVMTESNPEGHVMQYFVGNFDGKTFTCESYDKRQVLDYGENNYAAVTFAETSAPIMMGWGQDWNKARVNTNTEFYGKMTCARKLDLVKNDLGYFLKQTPIFGFDNTEEVAREDLILSLNEIYQDAHIKIINSGDTVRINDQEIERVGEGDMMLTVIRDHGFYEIIVDQIISYSQDL